MLLSVPDGIELMPLESLSLSSNRLTNDGWRDSLAALASSLRSLHIQTNKFRFIPPLFGFSRLERLTLQGNRLADWTLVLGKNVFTNAISSEQLVELLEFCGDPRDRWRYVSGKVLMFCVALADLELPSVQLLQIMDEADPHVARTNLFLKWRIVHRVEQLRACRESA
jgi:hypothetical protein